MMAVGDDQHGIDPVEKGLKQFGRMTVPAMQDDAAKILGEFLDEVGDTADIGGDVGRRVWSTDADERHVGAAFADRDAGRLGPAGYDVDDAGHRLIDIGAMQREFIPGGIDQQNAVPGRYVGEAEGDGRRCRAVVGTKHENQARCAGGGRDLANERTECLDGGLAGHAVAIGQGAGENGAR